ncbi:DNA alkylation repair protein [Sinorhizobium medicae]|uniref:DNA alkylation repair protein n=1 Tax=Sinorhizobium medicae TaxID=110321 RepID=UPI000C7A07B3|nr:DNA alkylation repair protein [Sinorhizobium medicae]MDX0425811.1 DNA alkylation repair protein [Sinorhizobium medicae]PLU04870.1 DNA alkylation repair protein [Sinorhizobium medicae]PLU58106.1 DNA alkylation repair protein [Sinorhizobium medicae]PLU64778.1 DNA alkylation repair protein [Sinorhizobium medicae]TWA22932.1 3-methyladenine DNA glycosylase AlkD [Sinorhizobium medicae]
MMPAPESTAQEIIEHLRALGSDENIAAMARFGIATENALGLSNVQLRRVARMVKTDHVRAIDLWASGIREARLLAAFTADSKALTLAEARQWANACSSWEVVDAIADLFVGARLEQVLIPEFAADEREFVRRLAFAMIATAAVHLKKEPDSALLAWLPLIEAHAADERNFVEKAVNWALRQIGKRSLDCHGPALALAQRLAMSANSAARWTGKDALRELTSSKVRQRLDLPD